MINVYNINNRLYVSAVQFYDLMNLAKPVYPRWIRMNLLESPVAREHIEFLNMEAAPRDKKLRRKDYYLNVFFACELCNNMKHLPEAVEIRNYLMDTHIRVAVNPEIKTLV